MIIVLAGGPSSERQVSFWTARTITDALKRLNLPYHQIDPEEPRWFETLQSLQPTIVILALHGPFGEDGKVQQLLEKHRIPFTGSGSKSAALAMNKLQAKEFVTKLGILTPKFQLFEKRADNLQQLPMPVVVKPNEEGSSYGVTLVWSEHQLEPAIKIAQEYDPTVLVEEYIAGTEVTCGVIDLFDEVQALPLVEIRPHTEFFDFEAKYNAKQCDEICPAELPAAVTKLIQKQSMKIFTEMKLRQYARIDWIVRQDMPYFLEVNTLPGLTANSLINKELTAAGIAFDQFLRKLIEHSSKNFV